MKIQNVVGVDVSKNTLDAVCHLSGHHRAVKNDLQGFKALVHWALKTCKLSDGEILFCFEHTGLYSLPLAVYLNDNKIPFCMVSALELKRSMGIARGKSDQVDAKRIANYAYLRRDEMPLTKLPAKALFNLQQLLSLRERMVKQRAGYLASIKEHKLFLNPKENKILLKCQAVMVKDLTKQIKLLELEMKNLISNDPELSRQISLLCSIDGIGPVLSMHLMVSTNAFTKFKTWRQFSCYCGIAPFEKQSGTSLQAPRRVHSIGSRKLKTLLTLASSSAIQSNPELRTYYNSRVQGGKSKMSTINIVRNKIVSRAFAVIARGTPYVQLARFAA